MDSVAPSRLGSRVAESYGARIEAADEADRDALAQEAQVEMLRVVALEEAGFIINAGRDDLLPNSVEFSGPGIINAKIVETTSPVENGRTLIEFDATLD